jgi:TolB-like protein/tRNA A-37 threonylcarbamoyl transferase component Bud32
MHLLEELQDALRDSYRVESEIGRGGMACVYLAEDVKHGRRVALKVLSPELSSSIDGDRFKREIQIAARLSHPHILPVFDSGEANGLLFYTMPFVEGESLRARLERERQLSIDDAITIACEVADALSYAHGLGVVHRDIKPENILLHGGHAVVADFGIARVIQESGGEKLTQTGMSVGTAAYMSPEQFSGDLVDGRSDMYSLACVLYELLVGQVPFTGPNAMAIMARHTMEMVPSIRIVRQTVPEEIEAVIMRALEKIPADRFQTVAQFKDALLGRGDTTGYVRRTSRYTAARGVPAAAAGGLRRRRAVLYAAVAVTLLAASGVAAAYLFTYRPRKAAAASDVLDSRRIAVLYLEDLSRDSSLKDVAIGLTQSLIDQLDQVEGLQVVSAAGVMPFAGKTVQSDSVARALRVGTLVRGSIEPVGNQLHVAIRLVEGVGGGDVSRAGFDVPKGAFLSARDSLAQHVSDLLRSRLGDEVRMRELRSETANVNAWALVQRGENLWRDGDRSKDQGDTTRAAQLYAAADSVAAQAAALDPRWPQPLVDRAAIAESRARLTKDPRRFQQVADSGLAYVAHALVIDPRSAAALEMRARLLFDPVQGGMISSQHDIDQILDRAARDVRDAVSFAPRRATAWHLLSVVEYAKKNVPEAMVAARRAYETDSYLRAAPAILWTLFSSTYALEQFSDAIRWCDEGRRRFPADPKFPRCQLFLAITKAVTPDPDEAWRETAALQALTPAATREYAKREGEVFTSIVLYRANLRDSANHVLARTAAGPDVDPRGELMGLTALAHEFFGEPDKAIDLLEQYLSTHPEHRAGFARANNWWWRDLQSNSRFKTLIASGR